MAESHDIQSQEENVPKEFMPNEVPISDTGASAPDRVIQTRQLFGDGRELVIEHEGERYRLRITRRGKLILQK